MLDVALLDIPVAAGVRLLPPPLPDADDEVRPTEVVPVPRGVLVPLDDTGVRLLIGGGTVVLIEVVGGWIGAVRAALV